MRNVLGREGQTEMKGSMRDGKGRGNGGGNGGGNGAGMGWEGASAVGNDPSSTGRIEHSTPINYRELSRHTKEGYVLTAGRLAIKPNILLRHASDWRQPRATQQVRDGLRGYPHLALAAFLCHRLVSTYGPDSTSLPLAGKTHGY